MGSDPDDGETQSSNRFFRCFNPMQFVHRNHLAVGNPRRQARIARLAVETQAEVPRQRADILLREPEFDERMPEAFLVHGLDTGAVVAEVGEVHAVRDRAVSQLGRDRFECGSQLLAAEVTAVRRVRHVLLVRQFGDSDGPQRDPDLRGLRHGFLEFPPGEGLGVGEDRERIVGERIVCDPRDQPAVDSTGEGDEHAPPLPHGLHHAVVRRANIPRPLGDGHSPDRMRGPR